MEGLDGSGNSTQIYLVKRWLELQGSRVYFTEWNSSLLVKKATSKGKKRQLLTPTTFSLIHATDFADRYERQIPAAAARGIHRARGPLHLYSARARCRARGRSRLGGEDLQFRGEAGHHVLFQGAAGGFAEPHPRRPAFAQDHEAGLDMGWSTDPYESFRIFQGKILKDYADLGEEAGFTMIDATKEIHAQQSEVRKIISKKIDLPTFRGQARQ